MAEITDYQKALEDLRRDAVESKDVRSFFTHLYSYTEKIIKTHILYAASVGVYSKSYLYDNSEANLGDLFKTRQFLEPDIIIPILQKAESDYRTKTRAHYSLLFLYTFYYQVVLDSNKDSYKVNTDKKHSKLLTEIREMLSAELSNIFDKNTDKGNKLLTRDIYELHLNIFHRAIIDFLSKNKIEVIDPDLNTKTGGINQKNTSKNIVGEASLRLEGRSLYVELPDNRSEVLCTYREGQVPLGLMEYMDKTYKRAPDTEFSLTDFASKVDDFMYDTMAKALRACGFDKHVKPMFFKRAPKGKIKFSPTKSINEIELQYILNCAKKNEEKRKSTGSRKKSNL